MFSLQKKVEILHKLNISVIKILDLFLLDVAQSSFFMLKKKREKMNRAKSSDNDGFQLD